MNRAGATCSGARRYGRQCQLGLTRPYWWTEQTGSGQNQLACSVSPHLQRSPLRPVKGQPSPCADFSRHQLTFGPSPIHPVDRLTGHLGGARLRMKREDVNSGLAFGGNKTRKLEYLVPDALAKGAGHARVDRRRPVQSHPPGRGGGRASGHGGPCWCREHWVELGRLRERPGRQHPARSRLMDADVRLFAGRVRHRGSSESWRQAISDVEESGGTPYAIPAGASDHPLGGLGIRELGARGGRGRRAELGVFFDTIVVCSVTGSTHAGMIAGFADLEQNFGGRPRRVLGIDASAKIERDRDQVGPDRAQHRRPHRPRPRTPRRRDHRARGLGRRLLRHPRRVDRRGDAAHRPPRGRSSSTPSTRASRWRASSSSCRPATSPRLEHALQKRALDGDGQRRCW